MKRLAAALQPQPGVRIVHREAAPRCRGGRGGPRRRPPFEETAQLRRRSEDRREPGIGHEGLARHQPRLQERVGHGDRRDAGLQVEIAGPLLPAKLELVARAADGLAAPGDVTPPGTGSV